YGITRYTLVKMGQTGGYFGSVISAGFHQKAIRMVCDGLVDASAIDCQVLAIELRDHPELREKLRVIDSFGPAPIQPIAVSTNFPGALKEDLRAVILSAHTDPAVRAQLDRGFIDRYVAVSDSSYDDIREMLEACERAHFLELR